MMMKKKTALIMFAILWMSTFSIQAGIRIGVKTGVNLANAAFSTNTIQSDNFTGFQVGPIIEFSGLTGWGVDAAILYSQQGFKIKDLGLNEKVSTIDIPVNLKLKLSLADQVGVFLSAGPYISFKVDDQTSLSQMKKNWETKQLGTGLNFGAGVILLKHLQVGVNYQLALNDDFINSFSVTDSSGKIILPDFKAKSRIWSITAAYFF